MLPLPLLGAFSSGRSRKAAVAGSFYPSSPDALRRMVQRYVHSATPSWEGPVKALIVPHAGLVYSGWVAAHAYKLLQKSAFSTVVVIGPAHYPASHPGCSLYAEGAFSTPLGDVPIDAALARRLIDSSAECLDRPDAHAREHCLEVQLPFLQEALGTFQLVPGLMRDHGIQRCRDIAAALAAVWREDLLLIASTDLSHYYPRSTAARMDGVVERWVNAFDPESLAEALSSGEAEMCGGGPALAVMLAARAIGCTRSRVLLRADSSDSPDGHAGPEEVVGYLAAAIA